MNLKFLSIALLFLLAAFISCNKSDENVQADKPVPHIKKITTVRGNDTSYVRLEYDDSGRLLRWISSYGYLTIFSYEPGKINRQIYLFDGTPYGNADVINFNIGGRVLSDGLGAFTYRYDEEGYLIEKTAHSNQNYVYIYTILNGNTTSMTEIFDNDPKTLATRLQCEFLPHSVNTIGEENMGRPYYGKQNKELTANQYDPSRALAPKINYHYELDAKNRVYKRIQENGPTDIYTYYD